jgi:hypothetical protein
MITSKQGWGILVFALGIVAAALEVQGGHACAASPKTAAPGIVA